MPDGMTRAAARPAAAPAQGAVILAGHLRRAVQTVGLAVEVRNTIPILANVLLRTEGGSLVASGTNMEQAMRDTAPCQGELSPVTADCRALLRLLVRLPAEAEVTLTPRPDLGALSIAAAGLRATLMALPAEDVPTWGLDGVEKGATHFRIPLASLRRLLSGVLHAISTEETRYYLNGIYLHPVTVDGAPRLRAVATDGHRLMVVDEAMPAGAFGLPGVIIPRQAVSSLRALLGARAEGDVRMAVTDTKIEAALGSWTLLTKAIDGTFPEYGRVIPVQRQEGRVRVHLPADLRRLIGLASSISHERSRPIKLEVGQDQVAVRFTAASPDSGRTEVEIAPETAVRLDAGKAIEVGFQARYMEAICAAAPRGFTLQVDDRSAPIRIDFEGGFGAFMPMRV